MKRAPPLVGTRPRGWQGSGQGALLNVLVALWPGCYLARMPMKKPALVPALAALLLGSAAASMPGCNSTSSGAGAGPAGGAGPAAAGGAETSNSSAGAGIDVGVAGASDAAGGTDSSGDTGDAGAPG